MFFCAISIIINSCGKDNNSVANTSSEHGSSATSYNGHEYVDLGLSVYWATSNIGANEEPTKLMTTN